MSIRILYSKESQMTVDDALLYLIDVLVYRRRPRHQVRPLKVSLAEQGGNDPAPGAP